MCVCVCVCDGCARVCACRVTTARVHAFIKALPKLHESSNCEASTYTIMNDGVHTCKVLNLGPYLLIAIYHHVSFSSISFSFSPVHSMQLISPSATS